MIKIWGKMRKVELFPTRDCEAGYSPGYYATQSTTYVVEKFQLILPLNPTHGTCGTTCVLTSCTCQMQTRIPHALTRPHNRSYSIYPYRYCVKVGSPCKYTDRCTSYIPLGFLTNTNQVILIGILCKNFFTDAVVTKVSLPMQYKMWFSLMECN